ncbi:MAG: hypothetical protein AAF215_17495 [Cyanobacteria bacterium P01_A01_bin.123]
MQSLPARRQITVTKMSMRSRKTDAAYWRTLPYEERLAALEQIRQDFIGWKYSAQPRFQRVYTVTKR